MSIISSSSPAPSPGGSISMSKELLRSRWIFYFIRRRRIVGFSGERRERTNGSSMSLRYDDANFSIDPLTSSWKVCSVRCFSWKFVFVLCIYSSEAHFIFIKCSYWWLCDYFRVFLCWLLFIDFDHERSKEKNSGHVGSAPITQKYLDGVWMTQTFLKHNMFKIHSQWFCSWALPKGLTHINKN